MHIYNIDTLKLRLEHRSSRVQKLLHLHSHIGKLYLSPSQSNLRQCLLPVLRLCLNSLPLLCDRHMLLRQHRLLLLQLQLLQMQQQKEKEHHRRRRIGGVRRGAT